MRSWIICGLMLISQLSFGQQNVKEQVFVHVSKSRLITGESLLFSAFVSSAQTGRLSQLSSILYVELLDSNGKSVYQTKINLIDGRGYGEYFVSSLLSTGRYHLTAYTRWMKNFNQFFHVPITIINPFETFDQDRIGKEKTLKIYPEGGHIIGEMKNKIVLRYCDGYDRGFPFKARLVSQDGDKIADILGGSDGLAEIEVGKNLEQGRIILEDAGGFAFYDLPSKCKDCAAVAIRESNQDYLVEVKVGTDFQESEAQLIVHNETTIFFERPLQEGSSTLLKKSSLPNELLQIGLYSGDGSLISSQLIHNGSIDLTNRDQLTSTTRSAVKVAFDRKDILSGSVVVKKVDKLAPGNIAIDEINSALISPPKVFGEQLRLAMKTKKARWTLPKSMETVAFMPEYRDDLLEGTVSMNDKSPIEDVIVGLSIPGNDYLVVLTRSDSAGKFLINLPAIEKNWESYVTIINNNDQDRNISMLHEFYDEYPQFDNTPIYFDSMNVQSIITKSINNQIENSFFDPGQDLATKKGKSIPQFNDYVSYELDDYTRFPTLRDTFIEYVNQVGISKNENKYDFTVRIKDRFPGGGSNYLLLFDGIPADAQAVLDYSPYNVRKIEVLNKHYFIGSVRVDGIIALNTLDGDFYDFNSRGLKYNYMGIQGKKHYSFPDYSYEKSSRRPDQRELLYWDPQLQPAAGTAPSFSFFTSDVAGTYEIRLDGITAEGEMVTLTKQLIVE